MKTATVKANFDNMGKISVSFATEIDEHQSRELLDQIAALFNDTYSDAKLQLKDKEDIKLDRSPSIFDDTTPSSDEDPPGFPEV